MLYLVLVGRVSDQNIDVSGGVLASSVRAAAHAHTSGKKLRGPLCHDELNGMHLCTRDPGLEVIKILQGHALRRIEHARRGSS